ncbi:mannosyltransferase family protein [Coleofasciculus chthonoplastes]|uniref:mannosyltransferase family protein n=1 Tax=Coleofasciculus chthonoplastes TaxID=64178 RepID=UPI004062B490
MNGVIFATVMWLLSRMVIAIAMLVIAPLLPAPPGGIQPTVSWDVFSAWDSYFYQAITLSGYDYVNDGQGHNVAFFPLFPLFVRAVMSGGLPFNVAGTVVNNLAFWGALTLLYAWVQESHGQKVARWTTAVLAWCPFSLFGTVIYTEGLFLLLSTAALRAYDRKHYGWSGLWGGLASATRLPGIALSGAFWLVAWREKRPAIAYLPSLATAWGLGLYSLYCGIRFGDMLAFLRVQQAWQPEQAFYGQGWLKMLVQISAGTANWNRGWLHDPWHPLIFVTICGLGYLLWRSRSPGENSQSRAEDCIPHYTPHPTPPIRHPVLHTLQPSSRSHLKRLCVDKGYGFYLLGILLWLLAGDPLINMIMVWGGGYLLVQQRTKLRPVAVTYGLCSLAVILSPGRTISAERHAYGIVSLAIALGLLLARYPRCGWATLLFFTLVLLSFAVRFSQHLWVA